MTLPDGCVAQRARRRRAPRCTASGSSRARRSPTVGAGDAFLAGYVAARYAGSAPAECLRYGVACGAESTQRLGAGLVDPRERRAAARRGRGRARSSARRGRLSPHVARFAAASGGPAAILESVAAAARHASQYALSTPPARGRFVRPRA